MSTSNLAMRTYKLVCNMPAMDTIAERVSFARNQMGWNQSELAREVGIKPQAIQQIEDGSTKKSRYLPDIAKACLVRYEWLSEFDGDMRSPNQLDKYIETVEQRITNKAHIVSEQTQSYESSTTDEIASLLNMKTKDRLDRINQLVADGKLSDDDMKLLEEMAERLKRE